MKDEKTGRLLSCMIQTRKVMDTPLTTDSEAV